MSTQKPQETAKLATKSASEMFIEAAHGLVDEISAERSANLDTDTFAQLRSEVIRQYEIAVHTTCLTALSAGMFREAHDVASEKIETVNSYMRGWLRNNMEPN